MHKQASACADVTVLATCMDSRVGITTPPLNRTAMHSNEDLGLHNSFLGSPQLVLRKSTTRSSDVHNLFFGSPQLVLRGNPQLVPRKSTTCSVHNLVVDCCQLPRRRPDAAEPSQSKGSRGLSGTPAGCPSPAMYEPRAWEGRPFTHSCSPPCDVLRLVCRHHQSRAPCRVAAPAIPVQSALCPRQLHCASLDRPAASVQTSVPQ
jgi:hypothetical protein